jgi:hypothetical protein
MHRRNAAAGRAGVGRYEAMKEVSSMVGWVGVMPENTDGVGLPL